MQLKTRLSPRTVADIVMLLSMLLNEAVQDRRIPFNPAHGVKVASGRRPERPHASAEQVAAIAARMRRSIDELMVVTAAYTGMRWGELAGLSLHNLDLDRADIHVHADVGALHEVEGKLFLGPPKTADSVRHIRLPAFLVALLGEVIDSHPYPIVFCGARGGFQRRSNFNRRAWTPAVAGDPDRGVSPILAGMHFHDLRHTHKTSFNAGVSLQALMALLGHVSAEMSLRYGRLFDTTIRDEYERALTLAKQRAGIP